MDFNTFLKQRLVSSFPPNSFISNKKEVKISKFNAKSKKIKKIKLRQTNDIFKKNLNLVLEEYFPEFHNFKDKRIKDREEQYAEEWEKLVKQIKINQLIKLKEKIGVKRFWQNFLNSFLKQISLFDYHFHQPIIITSGKAIKTKTRIIQYPEKNIKLFISLTIVLIMAVVIGIYYPKITTLITRKADNTIMRPFYTNTVFKNDKQRISKLNITPAIRSNYILTHKEKLLEESKNNIKTIKIKKSDLGGQVAGAYTQSKIKILPQQLNTNNYTPPKSKKYFLKTIFDKFKISILNLSKKQKQLSLNLDKQLLNLIKN